MAIIARVRKLSGFALKEIDQVSVLKSILAEVNSLCQVKGKGTWNRIDWTPERLKFLTTNYEVLTNKELADELGLKITAVRMKLYQLGYKRMELEYFTEEQTRFLVDNFRYMGDVEIAELFNQLYYKEKGWTKKHIEKKRKYLKLKRTEAEQDKIRRRNVAQGRFAVSHWRRWFLRETPLGETRIWKYESGRPFQVIKRENGFVHHAPWLWEQENGPVPEGMMVKFKDNNPLNVTLENLYLATRSEHGKSIITSDSYIAYLITGKDKELKKEVLKHPDLIDLKRTSMALNREIKAQEKS